MNASPPVLKIADLHVNFGTLPVLEGVSLDVAQGEILALVGESGSGKSVTAQTILRLIEPQGYIKKGEIWLDGEPIHRKSCEEMRYIRGKKAGMIFQDPLTSLNPTLTAGWQITEAVLQHENISTSMAKRRALELLDLVGIADPSSRYHAYPFQLSGGMRQRIMIAIALACAPLLLIADEPTTALDVTVQAQILDLLKRIRRETEMSLLVITHDLGVVANFCDRAAVMCKGRIVETADVHSLLSSPKHEYSKSLIEASKDKYGS
jgi:oligopeptide transport system ATP-binding protein